ncbi:MAG: transcriptional regulator [Salinimicrobium sp.]
MTQEELNKEKNGLIEALGVVMEKKHQLAPIAARIMSTLVLNGQQGVTFEELVQHLCAGKSTISTHLDLLQATRKIQFFTKPGDRKRYFVINPNLTIESIAETVAAWEKEQRIQESILEYKQKRNEFNREHDQPLLDLCFHEDLLIFLQESTAAITKLKNQIIKKSDKNELT